MGFPPLRHWPYSTALDSRRGNTAKTKSERCFGPIGIYTGDYRAGSSLALCVFDVGGGQDCSLDGETVWHDAEYSGYVCCCRRDKGAGQMGEGCLRSLVQGKCSRWVPVYGGGMSAQEDRFGTMGNEPRRLFGARNASQRAC